MVGGALALPFLRFPVSAAELEGRRAGGVSETTARMLLVLGAISVIVGVAWTVAVPLSVVSGMMLMLIVVSALILLALVMTLVRVVVRLAVGGALALPFLRFPVSAAALEGRRAGGVSETTARMLLVLRAILAVVGVAWMVARPSLLVASRASFR